MTQQIIISGNVGKDAELRDTRDSKVLSFNVGVKNGFGKDAGSVWYRCSLWGKAAESFSGSIKKGTKVFITGDLFMTNTRASHSLMCGLAALTLLHDQKLAQATRNPVRLARTSTLHTMMI
jgi:hypothetical protein